MFTIFLDVSESELLSNNKLLHTTHQPRSTCCSGVDESDGNNALQITEAKPQKAHVLLAVVPLTSADPETQIQASF